MKLTVTIRDEAVVRALEEEARRRGLRVEELIPALLTALFDSGMAFAEPFHRVPQEEESPLH